MRYRGERRERPRGAPGEAGPFPRPRRDAGCPSRAEPTPALPPRFVRFRYFKRSDGWFRGNAKRRLVLIFMPEGCCASPLPPSVPPPPPPPRTEARRRAEAGGGQRKKGGGRGRDGTAGSPRHPCVCLHCEIHGRVAGEVGSWKQLAKTNHGVVRVSCDKVL